jgi:hypothetical protein
MFYEGLGNPVLIDILVTNMQLAYFLPKVFKFLQKKLYVTT